MKKSAATQFGESDDPVIEPSPLHDVDELQLLRARIDEQSALIMILKQRADDAVSRASLFESKTGEQSQVLVSLELRLEDESRKFNMLENRFFELASNHEEMIKIKDEYKASNERLRTENIQLRRDNEQLFSKQLTMLTEECEAMRKLNEKIAREAKSLDLQNRKLEASLKESAELHVKEKQEYFSTHGNRIRSLEEELQMHKDRAKALNHEADELKSRLTAVERQHMTEIQRLTKEKDEMLALVMERGKIIQDKQTENKSLQLLTADLQKQLQATRQRFQEESDRVDGDLRVQRFKEQLKVLHFRYDSLSKAHEAFKRHAGSLLDNERLLNNQLAAYSSVSTTSNKVGGSNFSLPNINSSSQVLSYGLAVDSSSERR